MSLPRRTRAKDCTVPFTDNAGCPALMVFQGSERSTIPPLFCFLFYFTHPETRIDDIKSTAMEFLSIFHSPHCEFRIDLHFLPGADDEECVAHFEAELIARGSIQNQLDTLDVPDELLRHDLAVLPGLVPSYPSTSGFYRNFIFVVPTRDWQNEGQRLRWVRFGAMDEQEYRREMEESNEEVDGPLPPVSVREVWLRNDDMTKPGNIALGLGDVFNKVHHACIDADDIDKAWFIARNKPWQAWPVRKP